MPKEDNPPADKLDRFNKAALLALPAASDAKNSADKAGDPAPVGNKLALKSCAALAPFATPAPTPDDAMACAWAAAKADDMILLVKSCDEAEAPWANGGLVNDKRPLGKVLLGNAMAPGKPPSPGGTEDASGPTVLL